MIFDDPRLVGAGSGVPTAGDVDAVVAGGAVVAVVAGGVVVVVVLTGFVSVAGPVVGGGGGGAGASAAVCTTGGWTTFSHAVAVTRRAAIRRDMQTRGARQPSGFMVLQR